MSIEEFWNKAFIASLHRLPPNEAKDAADEALKICLEHWMSKRTEWAPLWRHWHDQSVSDFAPVQKSE